MDITEALDRAGTEQGDIVGRVYCALCGPKGLAVIRVSSEGLYFEADLPSAVQGLPPERVARQIADAGAANKRLPFVLAIGRCRYLLDQDPTDQDHPPRAECPKHGLQNLEVADLVGAVEGRQNRRAAVVTIHNA